MSAMNPDCTHVEVAFPLRGPAIPVDHGYALFAALSRCLPALHERPEWLVAPVSGRYAGRGSLHLTARSHLRIRLPESHIGQVLALAGRRVRVREAHCALGYPRVFPLRPARRLRARLVVIKGMSSSVDEFLAALRRQLAERPGLGQGSEAIELQPGPRRVLRIKGTAIPGFAVTLQDVPAATSIAIQAHGLGGRRHMGAGVFVPLRRESGTLRESRNQTALESAHQAA